MLDVHIEARVCASSSKTVVLSIPLAGPDTNSVSLVLQRPAKYAQKYNPLKTRHKSLRRKNMKKLVPCSCQVKLMHHSFSLAWTPATLRPSPPQYTIDNPSRAHPSRPNIVGSQPSRSYRPRFDWQAGYPLAASQD